MAKATAKRKTGEAKNTKSQLGRRDLIKHHASLLFSKEGYRGTTTEQICTATEMNKGTLYYYYASKSDILFDLCLSAAESALISLNAVKAANPLEELQNAIGALITYFYNNKNLVSIYYQEEHLLKGELDENQLRKLRLVQRSVMARLEEIIVKGMEAGYFRGSDANLSARFLLSSVASSYRWHDRDFKEIVQSAAQFIIFGLRG
jgi:AcrR family transcriptional regulator